MLRVLEGLGVIEPIVDRLIVLRIKVHLDRLERFDIQDVVAVVERGLLIIKRREAHAFEVTTIALLAAHHDPHGAPLRDVDWLDHQRNLVDEVMAPVMW